MSMTRLRYDDEDRKIRSALNRTQDEINGLGGLKKFTKRKTQKVEDSEEDEDF